jgi:hypothetical protein
MRCLYHLCGVLAGISNIPHKLRLQLLGAQFAAHMKCAFLLCDFFVPCTKIEDRAVVFAE